MIQAVFKRPAHKQSALNRPSFFDAAHWVQKKALLGLISTVASYLHYPPPQQILRRYMIFR